MALINRAAAIVAAVAVLAIAACTPRHADAQACPAPREPQAGDRCIALVAVPNWEPGKKDRIPVYVVRLKALDSSDLSSWTVPGAVVVPLNGLQHGQQIAVPLSILVECGK